MEKKQISSLFGTNANYYKWALEWEKACNKLRVKPRKEVTIHFNYLLEREENNNGN